MYTRLVKSVVVVLLLTLFACSEKESPIDLNKSDIVGEWETEYF